MSGGREQFIRHLVYKKQHMFSRDDTVELIATGNFESSNEIKLKQQLSVLALGQKNLALSDLDRSTSSGNNILSSCWKGMGIIILFQPYFWFFFF